MKAGIITLRKRLENKEDFNNNNNKFKLIKYICFLIKFLCCTKNIRNEDMQFTVSKL